MGTWDHGEIRPCYGDLRPWGHMDMRTYGHGDIWTWGYGDIWTWGHGDIRTWWPEDMWTWIYVNMGTCGHGDLRRYIWTYAFKVLRTHNCAIIVLMSCRFQHLSSSDAQSSPPTFRFFPPILERFGISPCFASGLLRKVQKRALTHFFASALSSSKSASTLKALDEWKGIHKKGVLDPLQPCSRVISQGYL